MDLFFHNMTRMDSNCYFVMIYVIFGVFMCYSGSEAKLNSPAVNFRKHHGIHSGKTRRIFKDRLCEGRCICDQKLTHINCTDAGITDLRDIAIPKSVVSLLIEGSSISLIPNGILQKLPNLQFLGLSQNNISTIQPQSLCSGNELRHLILDFNYLSELPVGCFKDCSKLRTLQLKANYLIIEQFAKILPYVPELETLDLSNNLFQNSSILPDEFASLKNLQYFYLDQIEIRSLADGFFNGLDTSQLKELSLMQNSIIKVSNESFANMDSLELLDISYTNLRVQDTMELFQSLSQSHLKILMMKYLYVYTDSNSISNSTFFHSLHNTSLKTLHIEGNYGAFNGILGKTVFAHIRHLQELYLDHNELKTIHHKAFNKLHKLKKLSLRKNYLTCLLDCKYYMESDVFHSLEDLDLSNNVIDNANGLLTFSSNVFPALRHLNLRKNQLSSIAVNTFETLRHLRALDLSENPITAVETGSFQGLIRMQTFIMEDCFHINSLPRHPFVGLRRLQTLKLNGNGIHVLENETFEGLYSLRELDLSHNRIGGEYSWLYKTSISSTNLTTLNLSYNNIEVIPKGLLEYKTKLQQLDISHNRITHFEGLGFKHTVNLKHFDLSFNNLVTLSKDSLTEVDHAEYINLEGNPFYCDCELNAAATWLQLHAGMLVHADNTKCAWPPNHKGTPLVDFKSSHLECYNVFRVLLLVTLGALLLVISCCILVKCKKLYKLDKRSNKAAKKKQLCEEITENTESHIPINSIETLDSPHNASLQANGNQGNKEQQQQQQRGDFSLTGFLSRKKKQIKNKRNGFVKLEKDSEADGLHESQSTI